MQLTEAIECYLVETRQIDALAKRQARMICECIVDEQLRNEAIIIVLLTLAALQKGSPRVDKNHLLLPVSIGIIGQNRALYTAQKGEPPRWADVLRSDLSGIIATVDALFDNPSRYAPVTGCEVAGGNPVWPVLVADSSYLGFSRYWCSTKKMEEKLLPALLRDTGASVDLAALKTALRQVFVEKNVLPEGKNFHFRQIAAAALACRTRFLIVSGGPGTGKTSVVFQILRTLFRMFPALTADRTVLCAPTGRAKARLGESINDGLDKLANHGAPAAPPDLVDKSLRLIHRKTLHSLLGQRPDATFRYNRENRLPHQLVIVDEVSMVDINLFASLLEALDDECRLILVGDMHQLPSVDAGALLGDLTECFSAIPGNASISKSAADWIDKAASAIPADGIETRSSVVLATPEAVHNAGALIDHAIILSFSYRSSKDILNLAEAVNRGDEAGAAALLSAPDTLSTVALDTSDGTGPVEKWCTLHFGSKCMVQAYEIIDKSDLAGDVPPAFIDAANRVLFDSIMLSLAHDGPRGRRSLNAHAERLFRHRRGTTSGDRFFHGQPIIVGSNHHGLDIYNGDLGVVVKTHEGLKACFPRAKVCRIIALDRLTDLEPAYALTVHKAQGSEFGDVLLVLPEDSNPLLTRQILYTGITRAKNSVLILGSEKILRKAVATREERIGGVVGRMKDEG